LHYGVDPYGFLQQAWQRHGDVFTIRVLGIPTVVFSHPDAVAELFALGPADVDAGVANRSLRPVIGTRNLLMLDGNEHLQRRRVVLPALHGHALRSHTDIVRQVVEQKLDDWPIGTPTPALPRIESMVLEIMLRVAFGVPATDRLAPFEASLKDLLAWATAKRRALMYALLGAERFLQLRAYRRRSAAMHHELVTAIAQRREDPSCKGGDGVLSLLLDARSEDGQPLSDTDVRDELVTSIVAGYETTSATLAWAMHELARSPDDQAQLAAREEGFAAAVVAETLRLHPPAVLVGFRCPRRPITLAGNVIPLGARVAACPALIHRRPDIYAEPDTFRPARFMNIRPASRAWLPFGGGVRRCVGAAFAEAEARIVLEELTRRFRLRPDRTQSERLDRYGTLVAPGRGAVVIATPQS
jgi:cytochrome P450